MTRQLLILRHAKSAWDTDVPTDFDRPLTKRGKKDAPRVGNWLCRQQLIPDYVLSSPAKRAKKTAVKVCQILNIEKHQINWDPRIYEAPTGRLLEVLSHCPATAKIVLLVGHNPGLEMLLEYLCETLPAPQDGKLLPTATVAHLEMPDVWSQLSAGAARLISLTRPSALPE
jgi:phosphohistidine phosphatase